MVKNIPNFIYGTAWKEAETTELVELALTSGFRAIDTANQAKHYSEPLVGEALHNMANQISRDQIWLQSKFTSIDGQDDRLPYDSSSNLTTQVKQSFASSLKHLNTDYLDSYLLHVPYNHPFLGDEDFEVWAAMESIYNKGGAKMIGVSNVNFQQLQMLVEESTIKPMTVQNRCFANRSWDKDVRDFCKTHNIHYQGFSLLTANPQVVNSFEVSAIAQKYKVTTAQIIFRFCHQIGMIPLTGTTSEDHMKLDLNIFDFSLLSEEIDLIENSL